MRRRSKLLITKLLRLQFRTKDATKLFRDWRSLSAAGDFIGSPNPMKPLSRTLLTSIRSVVFVACLALLALGLTDCAAPRIEKEPHITGIPKPDRWKEFVAAADRGEIEEVSDDSEGGEITFHLVSYRLGTVRSAHARAATQSDVFKGKFRLEAKTSYATRKNEKLTHVDTLMRSLPTDKQMTRQHYELVTKDRNHQNHERRIDLETRNVTVKAWLYWVGHQTDNDYHLILGDTSELTSDTVFMNAEVSGLPPTRPTQQPFVGLRGKLRQLLADNTYKKGAFITPVPMRITGSLLWDGEHRNPHNVGPKKPVDIRPKKAWEIHPIRNLKW
jgi:hypothetical protein